MTTSKDALDSLDTTALETLVLSAIKKFGLRGCISDELRGAFPTLAYSSVTARFANLVKTKRVWRPGATRPGSSGREQQIMWAYEYKPKLKLLTDLPPETLKFVKKVLYEQVG